MKESMRQRLQTLARALTKRNEVKDLPGTGSTDFTCIYMTDRTEIVPGIECTRAEAWISTKAICAHEAAHILFSCKKTWDDFRVWATREYPLPVFAQHVLNCIEDGRVERAMAVRYPQTENLFVFSNNYIFKHRKDWGKGLSQFIGGLICLSVVGDIPEAVNEPEILKLLSECRPYVEKGRKGLNTADAAFASKHVLKLAQPLVAKALEDIKEETTSKGTLEPEKAPFFGSDTRRRRPKRLDKRVKEIEEEEKREQERKEREKLDEEVVMETEGKAESEKEAPSETERDNSKEDKSALSTDSGDEDCMADESDPFEGAGETDSCTDIEEPKFNEKDEPEGPESDQDPESFRSDDLTHDPFEDEPDSSENDNHDKPEFDLDKPDSFEDDPEDLDNVLDEPECGDDDPAEPFDEDGTELDDEEFTADMVEDTDEFGEFPDFDGEHSGEEDEGATGELHGDRLTGRSGASTPEVGDDSGDDPLEGLTDLVKDAADELEMIDRRERDLERPEEISLEALCADIDWKEMHRNIQFDVIRYTAAPSSKNLERGMAPHAKRLAKEIKPYLRPKINAPLRTQKRGRVDGRALWKTCLDEDAVFYKKAEPSQKLDVAAYMLVDGSGSMSEEVKIDRAREAAMLCHLTLKDLQIVHAATLFDAAFDYPIVRHEELIAFSKSNDASRLMHIRAKCDNRDGYSIRIAAKELAVRPEKKKILFVLSDGEPAHGYDGYAREKGNMDTRRAAVEAERNGITVIGIHFGHTPSEVHKLMYPNLVYSKIDNLPSALGAVLKKTLKH
ncbi:MAG: hypothetical protein KGZ79_16685 [Dethiobacter sp.]|jgi:hypothetical protein|nr:hypothetical protein [Dethiobacter sp.]